MKLAIHAGAHGTEEDRLLKSLQKDSEPLLEAGTAVAEPAAFRTVLKDCFAESDAGGSPQLDAAGLLSSLTSGRPARRTVLSHPHFFGSPRLAADGRRLYPAAARRMLQMQHLFPEAELELFFCLRNPAALLPALLAKAPAGRVRSITQEHNPLHLRWSQTLLDIRAALPDLPMTVWCFEDLPFIWDELLQALTGQDSSFRFSGSADMAKAILSKKGGSRLSSYLAETPGISGAQKRRVIATFLDKFAREDALEEELDLPGWTEELVDSLTEVYEADLDTVAELPGVTLIEPGPL